MASVPHNPPRFYAPAAGKRLLLVEDDAAVAETTAQMLRSLGYEVVIATLPSQALAIMQDRGKDFHLMISDITMPEMNGYELAVEVRQQFGPIPVLFVTGYDFSMSESPVPGIILQKPLSLSRLAGAVMDSIAAQGPSPTPSDR